MYSFPTLDDVFRSSSVFSPRVYVISDSQYQEHKQAQAKDQVARLEARAEEYRKYLATLEASIVEVKTEAGLLPPSTSE